MTPEQKREYAAQYSKTTEQMNKICKHCAHGTIKKNDKGRPKGYCKHFEFFTNNVICCGAFKERL